MPLHSTPSSPVPSSHIPPLRLTHSTPQLPSPLVPLLPPTSSPHPPSPAILPHSLISRHLPPHHPLLSLKLPSPYPTPPQRRLYSQQNLSASTLALTKASTMDIPMDRRTKVISEKQWLVMDQVNNLVISRIPAKAIVALVGLIAWQRPWFPG